jgi:hypothetical protein
VPVYLEALFFTPSGRPTPYVHHPATGAPVSAMRVTTNSAGIATFTVISREKPTAIIYPRSHLAGNGGYDGYCGLAVVSGQ